MAGILPIRRKTQKNQSINQSLNKVKQLFLSKRLIEITLERSRDLCTTSVLSSVNIKGE